MKTTLELILVTYSMMCL